MYKIYDDHNTLSVTKIVENCKKNIKIMNLTIPIIILKVYILPNQKFSMFPLNNNTRANDKVV